MAYLSGGRSRLFATVPELELTSGFRWREVKSWIDRIPSGTRRTLVMRRLARFLRSVDPSVTVPRWLRQPVKLEGP